MNSDCVLILDEMYLEKSSEYHGGKYVGLDEVGKFYKGTGLPHWLDWLEKIFLFYSTGWNGWKIDLFCHNANMNFY